MTQPNPRWARWIKQSITKYFRTNVTTPASLPFLVDGIDMVTSAFTEAPDRAECRVNGPFTKEMSANYWRLWVDINVLVMSHMDESSKNIYTLEANAGLFHEAMDTCIPIYRLGDVIVDPQNDQSLLGYLRPRTDLKDSVKNLDFGQIDKTDRLREQQLDARYVMYVTT